MAKRVYLCWFCGKKEVRRISEGMPEQGKCRGNTEEGVHSWVEKSKLSPEQRLLIRFRRANGPEREDIVMYQMGDAYFNGNVVKKDQTLAVEWYRKAATAGSTDAMYALGYAYKNGTGVKQDEDKAMKWYHTAAEEGHAGAMLILGRAHEKDYGATLDNTQAMQWYQAAAEKGNIDAMLALAHIYESGGSTEEVRQNVLKWYREAAKQKVVVPIRALNKYLTNLWFFPPSWDQIKKYNENRLAWKGYAYEFGIDVEQDQSKAIEYYRKAAELGDRYSMFALGNAYEHGKGITRDTELAIEWYRKAIGVMIEWDDVMRTN